MLPTTQPDLLPGERIIWQGAPQGGIKFRVSDWFMIPFSLMWGGFAFFWEYQVVASGAPIFFRLWGVPFVVIGCFLIFGRFFLDAYFRAKLLYYVTNNRIIITNGENLKSYQLSSLPNIEMNKQSIIFEPNSFMGGIANRRNGFLAQYSPSSAMISFDFIDDAQSVYQLILSNIPKN